MTLKRDPNVADPDGLYAAIIDAHADLSDADSAALNARLVLLLANHIGDPAVAGRGPRHRPQVARQVSGGLLPSPELVEGRAAHASRGSTSSPL